ncbi:hypothetical protein C8R45DRAFT_478176 [Mycena sanguinolenta]|nr:hypothetical protein C8R45DRAFT_478176 [Mycena sanguinolenta]
MPPDSLEVSTPDYPSSEVPILCSELSLEAQFSYALDAFKYRLWFTGFTWYMSGKVATPPWVTILSEESVFWLWEDEDEEYIKQFAQFLPASHSIPFGDSHGTRPCRTVTANPLAHLTPKTRLLFVAWLMVAGPIRKDRILKDQGLRDINMLIYDWFKSTALFSDSTATETCRICSVSHLLPIWMETLSQIYPLEDLKSLPWSGCDCLNSQLSAYPGPLRGIQLEKHSLVLHILYELVVPPWALVHWVTFRITAKAFHPPAPLPVTPFLEMIPGLDKDLFAHDVDDNLELCRNLRQNTQSTLYPPSWIGYMVEIPLKTWQEISIWTIDRPRRASAPSMRARLAAVFLKYSCTEHVLQSILASFGTNLEYSLFDRNFVACVVAPNHSLKEQPTPPNLNSVEFWASPNLENWLSASRENLCRTMWNSSSRSKAVERVEDMLLVLVTLPHNLTVYAYHLRLRYFRLDAPGRQLERGSTAEVKLPSALSQYRANVKILIDVVKESIEVLFLYGHRHAGVY